jgi:hypothetical protein
VTFVTGFVPIFESVLYWRQLAVPLLCLSSVVPGPGLMGVLGGVLL